MNKLTIEQLPGNVFINREGQQEGPYNVDQINQLLTAGRLLWSDWVWVEGWPEWRQLDGLVPARPPPLPASAPEHEKRNIYLAQDEQQSGPYTLTEINSRVERKAIAESDLAWMEEWTEWKKVADIISSTPLPRLSPPLPSPSTEMRSESQLPPLPTSSTSRESVARSETECPMCCTKVPRKAILCMSCGFPVGEFLENCSQARYSTMQRSDQNSPSDLKAVLSIYKHDSAAPGSGCASIIILIAGGCLLLVPVVGWFFGPICLLFGFIWFVFPVWGAMILENIFDRPGFREKLRRGRMMFKNTFESVICPACGTTLPSITWEGEGGFVDCPSCSKQLLRQENYLFSLPYPDAIPNHDMIKAFVKTRPETP